MNSLKKNSDTIQFFFLRIFSILSAILYLGNVTYKKKATGRDEGLDVGPPEVLDILSQLLKVENFFLALMCDAAVCSTSAFHWDVPIAVSKSPLWYFHKIYLVGGETWN